jgi:hypothetical protein
VQILKTYDVISFFNAAVLCQNRRLVLNCAEMDPFAQLPWDSPDEDTVSHSETESCGFDFAFDLKDPSVSDSTPDIPMHDLPTLDDASPWRVFSADVSPMDVNPQTAPPPRPPRLPLPRRVASSRGPPLPVQCNIPALRAAPFLIGKVQLSAMEQFQPHPRQRPAKPWTSATPSAIRSDQLFADVCKNPSATLNPASLGFIPVFFWPNREFPFGDLVYDFFQRKNNVNSRFLHKLYNALRISTISVTWAELVGVQWQAPFVIRVNKGQFARLLGIQTIEGSLFHQQGNFRTHGFVELNREQMKTYCPNMDISQIDFDDVRLLIHQPGIFVRSCTEQQLQDMQEKMTGRPH